MTREKYSSKSETVKGFMYSVMTVGISTQMSLCICGVGEEMEVGGRKGNGGRFYEFQF
jgi:hypothetical protein